MVGRESLKVENNCVIIFWLHLYVEWITLFLKKTNSLKLLAYDFFSIEKKIDPRGSKILEILSQCRTHHCKYDIFTSSFLSVRFGLLICGTNGTVQRTSGFLQ